MIAGACNFDFFLPKIGLCYVAIMYRIEKTSRLQNFTKSIVFYPVQPSPCNKQYARRTYCNSLLAVGETCSQKPKH